MYKSHKITQLEYFTVISNKHNVPLDKILYIPDRRTGHCLVVDLGPSDMYEEKTRVHSRRIAELYAPTKCTWHIPHRSFKPICDLSKRILLGEVTLDNWLQTA